MPRFGFLWPLRPHPNLAILTELAVIGRCLKPGISIAGAQAAMDLFTAAIERASPESKGWFNSRVTSLTEQVIGDTRKPLLLILGAVGVLLLIACVNVANLLSDPRSVGAAVPNSPARGAWGGKVRVWFGSSSLKACSYRLPVGLLWTHDG